MKKAYSYESVFIEDTHKVQELPIIKALCQEVAVEQVIQSAQLNAINLLKSHAENQHLRITKLLTTQENIIGKLRANSENIKKLKTDSKHQEILIGKLKDRLFEEQAYKQSLKDTIHEISHHNIASKNKTELLELLHLLVWKINRALTSDQPETKL